MSIQPFPPGTPGQTFYGVVAARGTANDQALAGWLADHDDRIGSLESDSGTSGTGAFTIVSTNTTIPAGTQQGQLAAYRNSAVSSVTVSGTTLASGEWGVWAWLGSSWSLLNIGSATGGIGIPTGPDTTNPIPGTLSPSVVTETGFTVTVTGASDDRVLSTGPYSFSVDGGAWSAWQASADYVATGLTASTTYNVKHRVRDAAGNIAEGVSINVSTPAPTESWTWVESFDGRAAEFRFHQVPLSGGTGSWISSSVVKPGHVGDPSAVTIWQPRSDGMGRIKGESDVAFAGMMIDQGQTPARARILFDVPADTEAPGKLVRVGVATRVKESGGTGPNEFRGVWMSYVFGTGVTFQYANNTAVTTVATYTAAGTGALDGTLTVEYDGSTARGWFNDTLVGTVQITGLDGTYCSVLVTGAKTRIDHFWGRPL